MGQGANSLRMKIARWVHRENKKGEPTGWMKELIGRIVLDSPRGGNAVLVLGDLNSTMEGQNEIPWVPI